MKSLQSFECVSALSECMYRLVDLSDVSFDCEVPNIKSKLYCQICQCFNASSVIRKVIVGLESAIFCLLLYLDT